MATSPTNLPILDNLLPIVWTNSRFGPSLAHQGRRGASIKYLIFNILGTIPCFLVLWTRTAVWYRLCTLL